MADRDLARQTAAMDATEQAELVRRGEIAPGELVEAAIERIERHDPELNAVIHKLYDRARDLASSALPGGPFSGVPFLLKDLGGGESQGDPYHLGASFLKRAGWKATRTSTLVERFRAAGLVDVGRTNVPELGAWTTTEPEAHGPTRNPWNPGFSSGGSSGGAGAAVAAGLVPFAHASDGGGSIRIPASACGLVGLKTTRGRTSLGPAIGESWAGLVVEFAVTRSVRDAAALLDAVHGAAPGDPYHAAPPSRPYREAAEAPPGRLRAGLITGSPRIEIHPECVAAAEQAARLLEELGHEVEHYEPLEIGDEARVVEVIAANQARDVARWEEVLGRELVPGDLDSDNWGVTMMGREIPAHRYLAAVEALHGVTREIARWWEDERLDVLVTPTLPRPPAPIGTLVPDPANPFKAFQASGAYTEFTMPWNITGQPAISLPLHWTADETLPVGVQFAGRFGAEDLLLSLATQIEAARPWADRRPRVWAGAEQ